MIPWNHFERHVFKCVKVPYPKPYPIAYSSSIFRAISEKVDFVAIDRLIEKLRDDRLQYDYGSSYNTVRTEDVEIGSAWGTYAITTNVSTSTYRIDNGIYTVNSRHT